MGFADLGVGDGARLALRHKDLKMQLPRQSNRHARLAKMHCEGSDVDGSAKGPA